jgi:hypothetical protein
MDCNEYIESYLSAHADRELTPAQVRDAEAHLGGCAACRAELESERGLKALLRDHVGVRRIPAPIEARIRSALAVEPAAAEPVWEIPPAATRRRRTMILQRRAWIPMAIAAMLLVTLITAHMINRSAGVPMFDVADEKLDDFSSEFTPNVPSANPAEVSTAYHAAGMPSELWDFSNAGFKMAGGRIDTMPDGQRVVYTLYRGPFGASILCMMTNGVSMPPPPDAVMRTANHQCYRYNRASVCLSYGPKGSFTCILVTHEPVEHLMRIIRQAEAAKQAANDLPSHLARRLAKRLG